MSNKNMTQEPWYKNSTVMTLLISTVLIAGFFLLLTNGEDIKSLSGLEVSERSHSWGEIPIEGGDVSYEFAIKNNSGATIKIENIFTSCMCTSAQLITPDQVGPLFRMEHDEYYDESWTGELKAGQEGVIRVVYDPYFHGPTGVGSITRTVTVETDSPDKLSFDLRVDAKVVSGAGEATSYDDITPNALANILATSDPFLLDVHVPRQTEIKGTDQFIEYTEITQNTELLPEDKDALIVVYCRSGNMSKEASQDLYELGYTNIKNLEGGTIAWEDAGFKL